jgi:predicted AAA+ superfamily ATPase
MGELPDAMLVKNGYTAIISSSSMICLIRDESSFFERRFLSGLFAPLAFAGHAGRKRRLDICW